MADAVVAVTIFQQNFPSTLAMECDGERDRSIFFVLDTPGFLFPYLVHFLLLFADDLGQARSVSFQCLFAPVLLHAVGIGRMSSRSCFVSSVSGRAKVMRW